MIGLQSDSDQYMNGHLVLLVYLATAAMQAVHEPGKYNDTLLATAGACNV